MFAVATHLDDGGRHAVLGLQEIEQLVRNRAAECVLLLLLSLGLECPEAYVQ